MPNLNLPNGPDDEILPYTSVSAIVYERVESIHENPIACY
jgi:hypothetical protein